MNKVKSLIIGSIIIVAVFVLVLVQNSNKNIAQYTTTATQQLADNSTTSVPLETINPTVVNPKPVVVPTPTPQPGVYTLADVAKHSNKSDCWTTINGGVYNVTSWINQHPGGEQAIIGLCGIDGSSAFNGQHGTQKRPASELASFKIGILK